MMKLAQRLSFLNRSGVHRHTSGLARRAVLILSLLVFCLGSVWGQTYEVDLIGSISEGNHAKISKEVLAKYDNSSTVRFYFEITRIGMGTGWGVAKIKKYDEALTAEDQNSGGDFKTPSIGNNSTHNSGDRFYVTTTIGNLLSSSDDDGISVHVWNANLLKATVFVKDNSINTQEPASTGFDSEPKDINKDASGTFSLSKIKDKITDFPDTEIKYARIFLTKNGSNIEYNANIVDDKNLLDVIGGKPAGVSAIYGLYIYNENEENIDLSTIDVTLNAGIGGLDKYKVVVLLSKTAPTVDGNGNVTKEPQWDYEYTYSFTYPSSATTSTKVRHKTLIITDTNNPQVSPILISNWFELAGDCGVDKQGLADNLYVRWYLANEKGEELPVNITASSPYINIAGGGFYKNKGFNVSGFDERGRNGTYNIRFTLWGSGWNDPRLPSGYDYKNVRLVCVATTKTNGYNVSGNWTKDPEEIQVKYVYTLKTTGDLQTFAHYEGEAFRYLNEIGNDATDYAYLTSDKDNSIGTNTAPTWNSETNEYNPGTKSVRQNVHTVHYYYYVETSKPLTLPLQEYTNNGSGTEPRAYFRWYDYKTDRHSNCLDNGKGDKLSERSSNGQNYGLFALNLDNTKQVPDGDPKQSNIGVIFTAPDNFNDEIQIACDVSRYMDGMDESFTHLVHEPTLSIRYLFHMLPAKTIAGNIDNAGSLAEVEKGIMEKGKPSSILEDEGRMVVSTNKGYGEFALRTQLSDLGQYYINENGTPTPAKSLWWYAYYKDENGKWWRKVLPNIYYRDRDGNVAGIAKATVRIVDGWREEWDYSTYTWDNALYRTQTHHAKYSLKPKQWPDLDLESRNGSRYDYRYDGYPGGDKATLKQQDGDFDGKWQPLDAAGKWGEATETNAPTIDVGSRVQMVACVSTENSVVYNNNRISSVRTEPTGTIKPIIWTELEFIDAAPQKLGEEDNERSVNHMTTEYRLANKLEFNDFSLMGMRKPTHSFENFATYPLNYPNAQYGFIYPQLYGYCATMRFLNWGDRPEGYFGMAAMHADYGLLKSMNMEGISMDKDIKVGGNSISFSGQSIQVDWVNGGTLFDVTHERVNHKNTPESNDYGGFIYVDAADESRTIATLDFKAQLCKNAKIYYTAYVASMTGLTRPIDYQGKNAPDYGVGTPQTAPMLRFRVSVYDKVTKKYVPVVTFVTGNIRQEVNYDPVANQESAFNNNQCPFKEATWYQVYGYTTIPSEVIDLLGNEEQDYHVEIDNYCDNTDGADYCVDQIAFYTNNAQLRVKQATKLECDKDGIALNVFMEEEQMKKLQIVGQDVYWRICINEGATEITEDNVKVLTGKDFYGVGYDKYGKVSIPVNEGTYIDEDKLDIHGGYFKLKDDNNKEVICYSFTSDNFVLPEGKDYYISIYMGSDPENSSNKEWGNPCDICSAYSPVFVPKTLFVSVSDKEGNVNPIIEVACSDHVAHLADYTMILNVPNDQKESGFEQMKIPFDYFVGSFEENYNLLAEAIEDYRARKKIEEEQKTLGWNCKYKGLDPQYQKECDARTDENEKQYYNVLNQAVEDGKLYLDYSSEFSLPIDAENSTVWVFAAIKEVYNSKGEGPFQVCSPMRMDFEVEDDLIDPLMTLGFDDVDDYPTDYKQVVRVGLEQLKMMKKGTSADNNYKLHIPVKSYGTKEKETYQEGAKADTKLYFLSSSTEQDAVYLTVSATTDPHKQGDQDAIGKKFAKIMSLADGESPYVDASHMYLSLDLSECEIDFHEGYEYEVSTSFANMKKPDEKSCIGDLFLVIKVVPKYVTWDAKGIEDHDGYYSANWYDDTNWMRSQSDELYKDDYDNTQGLNTSDRPGYVPMKFTYVTLLQGNHAPSLIAEPKVALDEDKGISKPNQGGGLIDPTKETGTDMTSASSPFGETSVPTTHIRYDMMVRYGTHTKKGEGCFGHRKQILKTEVDGTKVIEWKDDVENAPEKADANVFDVEKFYGNVCKEIYFKPMAELINQQHLAYEKAWVEKELEANKWYLMSTPLKATYAGDMYVPYNETDADKNGKQETEAFENINFTDADITYSRTGYPVYQKSWDHGAGTGNAGNVYTKDNVYSANLQFTGSVTTTFAQWTHTYNDMEVKYDGLHGFALRAHKNAPANATALLRLPKADETYTYYDYEGKEGGKTASTSKTDGYARFVTDDCDESNRETALITEPLHVNINADNSYYLIGNPYMASLDMAKFFEKNSNLTGEYWKIDDNASQAGLKTGQVKPLESFFVKLQNTDDTSIKFTSDMMIDGNHPTAAPNPVRPMTMTAANTRGQSAANVSVGEEAKSVATLFDSNLNDVPMVYTVADGQAVSINQVTDLNKPIAFGVTCAASDEPVDVTFSDIEQLTNGEVFVVDAANGSKQQVTEGGSYSVQPNDYGRYFLTFAGGTTGISEAAGIGVVVSVRGRMVTVTSGETLTEVRAISPDGATVYRDTAGGTTTSFTLAPGVYVVKAENAAGEQQTVKVIVK